MLVSYCKENNFHSIELLINCFHSFKPGCLNLSSSSLPSFLRDMIFLYISNFFCHEKRFLPSLKFLRVRNSSVSPISSNYYTFKTMLPLMKLKLMKVFKKFKENLRMMSRLNSLVKETY